MRSARSTGRIRRPRNQHVFAALQYKSHLLLKQKVDESVNRAIAEADELPNISLSTPRPAAGSRNLPHLDHRSFYRSVNRSVNRSVTPSRTPIDSRKQLFTLSRATPNTKVSPIETARMSVSSILSSHKQIDEVYKDSSTLTTQEILELVQARCQDNGIVDWEQHVQRFIDLFRSQCTNGRLVLHCMKLGKSVATVLARIISRSPHLSELSLDRTELGDSGAAILARGLVRTRSLVHLRLSSSKLSYLGAMAIFAAVGRNRSITCLDLSSCGDANRNRAGPASMSTLKEAFGKSNTIGFINLSGNGIGDLGLADLVEGVVNGTGSVLSLNLSFNSFTHAAVPDIARLVSKSKSLIELDISGNLFGKEFFDVLPAALSDSVSLRRTILRECQITHEEVNKLFTFPKCSPSLSRIVLDSNQVSGRSFLAVKDMLTNHSCRLDEFSLSHCGLQNEDIVPLALGVEAKCVFVSLNLSHNEIRDQAAAFLAHMIRVCADTFRSLDISNNRVSDLGGRELLSAMKDSRALQRLDLAGNMLTDLTAAAVIEDQKILDSVVWINLDYNFISERLKMEIAKKSNRSASTIRVMGSRNNSVMKSKSIFTQIRSRLQEKRKQGISVESIERDLCFLTTEQIQAEEQVRDYRKQLDELKATEYDTHQEIAKSAHVQPVDDAKMRADMETVEREIKVIGVKFAEQAKRIEGKRKAVAEETKELSREIVKVRSKLGVAAEKHETVMQNLQSELERAKGLLYNFVHQAGRSKTRQVALYKEAVVTELKRQWALADCTVRAGPSSQSPEWDTVMAGDETRKKRQGSQTKKGDKSPMRGSRQPKS